MYIWLKLIIYNENIDFIIVISIQRFIIINNWYIKYIHCVLWITHHNRMIVLLLEYWFAKFTICFIRKKKYTRHNTCHKYIQTTLFLDHYIKIYRFHIILLLFQWPNNFLRALINRRLIAMTRRNII